MRPPSHPASIADLIDLLKTRFDASLRSCVEYRPQSKRILYLREDVDSATANKRLIRVDNLYQTTRVNRAPIEADPALGQLEASLHYFGAVVVVHLLDRGGRAIGFSVDADALPTVQTLLVECLEVGFEGSEG